MKMLVDDVKNAWKWASTWVLALTAGIGAAWDQLPQFQAYLPPEHFGKYVTGLAVVAFISRIIKQTPTPPQ